MELYTQITLHLLLPMATGALMVMITVLLKGEICPGQRGRIHKQIPIIAGLFFVSTVSVPLILLPAALLSYFLLQVKTGKTRDRGPISLLFFSLAAAIIVWFSSLVAQQPMSLFSSLLLVVSELVFLGASLSHLLMVRARTRLDAFHTLLPVAGVVSAMVLVLAVLAQTHFAWSDNSASVVEAVSVAFPMLLLAIVIWCWHLFRSVKVNQVQLTIALASGLGSSYLLLPVF